MQLSCVTVDAEDPHRLAAFWAAALGWEATRMDEQISVCARPGVQALYLEFVRVPEPKTVKNRVHLGTNAGDDLDAEIERLCRLGATLAWEEDLPPGFRNVVLLDPEGNEFCLGARTQRGTVTTLDSPLRIGTMAVRNRMYRAPVLEGAGDGPDAAERYARAFVPNARHGVGLIIQGSSCLYEEGRTSPGMTLVHTRERVLAMADMVAAVRREGAAIVLQVGHGGLYSMEAWHEPYASTRKGPLLAPSPVPWLIKPIFARVPVHVMTTDEVHALARQYGDVASWAREAGYDGIQLGSANAKLLDQFLSPFYNRRTDEFGGSPERRASILRVIRESIAERAGADYPTLVKVPAEQAPPLAPHVSADEALHTCTLVEEWGFDAVTPVEVSVFPDTTLSRGDVPSSIWENASMKARFEKASPSKARRRAMMAAMWIGGKRSPFTPVWNRALFRQAKRRVSIPVFAVGGIRTGAEARRIVEAGEADMVGFGRPFYVQDDLAEQVLADGHARCRNSNKCVPAEMLGMKGVCYNPEVTRRVKTLAVLLAALVGSVWGGAAAGAGTAPRTLERPGLPALHAEPDPVDGGRIVDARGREVLLRGVNVNVFAEYWKGNEFATTFPLARRDPARMAGIGWNAVRLLLSWSRVEPEPGEYDEAYLDRIARAVDRFAAEGIYTILDLHQDAWGPTLAAPEGTQCPAGSQPALGWDGAPGWATFDDGEERCAQGGIRELSPAVMAAWSAFFADRPAADGTGIQTRYVDMLAHVAGRFARDPAVAGYDLVNEPNAFSDEHAAALSKMYGRAIVSIRAAEEEAGGVRHLVLFEPPAIWSSTGRGAPPDFPHDDDVVYAPHPYTGDPADPAAFAVAVDEARAFGGAPVLFGEWGGDPDSTTANGETFFVDHQDRQDELRASATLWTWRESCGDPHKVRDVQGGGNPEVWGEFDVDCATNDVTGPRRDLIADLTHGYVRAAPGRLSSTRYEAATGAFVASGDAGDSTAPVVVFLPAEKDEHRVVDVSGLRRPTTEQVRGGLLLRAVPSGGAWEVRAGGASE